MAACGSLEHIFENPLPENQTFLESLSPIWNHVKPSTAPSIVDSSFTEIFGELHFQENNDDNNNNNNAIRSSPELSPTSCRAGPNVAPKARTGSPDSLSLCTEGLGFESFDEAEGLANKNGDDRVICNDTDGCEKDAENHHHRNYNHHRHRSSRSDYMKRSDFPPPISCIGRSGKPWVCFKSYREGGRFILKEIRIPTQEFLHACREDGRLKMHFISSDDEIYDDDEDDDKDDDDKRENLEAEFAGEEMKDR